MKSQEDFKAEETFYIPPGINPRYLKDNRKLLSNLEVNFLYKQKENGLPPGRYSKNRFGTEFGIIIGTQDVYAIVRDVQHNKQQQIYSNPEKLKEYRASIKHVQNLRTKEFIILKTIKLPKKVGTFKHYNLEHEALRAMQMTKEPQFNRLSIKSCNLKGNLLIKYAKGKDLEDLLKQDAEPEARWNDLMWLHIARKVIAEVVQAHALGFIHGDLKLANIRYDAAGDKATLVDWGLTKKITEDEFDLDSPGGTYGYAAPEIMQYMKDKLHYTPAIDVYSLGVVLWQTLFDQTLSVNGESKEDGTTKFSFCNLNRLQVPSAEKKLLFEKIEAGICTKQDFPKMLFENDAEITAFLKQMMASNPDGRPSMQAVANFFSKQEMRYTFTCEGHTTAAQFIEQAKEYEQARLDKAKNIIQRKTEKRPGFFRAVSGEQSPKQNIASAVGHNVEQPSW